MISSLVLEYMEFSSLELYTNSRLTEVECCEWYISGRVEHLHVRNIVYTNTTKVHLDQLIPWTQRQHSGSQPGFCKLINQPPWYAKKELHIYIWFTGLAICWYTSSCLHFNLHLNLILHCIIWVFVDPCLELTKMCSNKTRKKH